MKLKSVAALKVTVIACMFAAAAIAIGALKDYDFRGFNLTS